MCRYLNNLTDNIKILFNQRSDGHGLKNVLSQIEHDTDLLIIVDSSTNSVEECKTLQKHGIDVVILDHHPKTVNNPYAILVNNLACKYPNKELSGAGIVFKVCQVLDEKLKIDYAYDYVDLVGLGIYGDVMSVLEPENRWLIYWSLKNITNPGIKAILNVLDIKHIDSSTYGFSIVPLINAAARMNQIELIIKLLICDDWEKCIELAKECKKLNDTRKKEQKKIYKRIQKNKQIDPKQKIIIVVTDESNKGFNGLIAADIANKFSRPCLVVRNNDGLCEGSGRGYGDFNLKVFLQKSGLFEYLEGHSSALGVGFRIENLDKIHEYINENLKEVKFESDITYDLELDLKEIDYKLIKQVQEFNFITSNKDFPPVRFLVKNIPIREMKIIGKNEDTIKIVSEGIEALKFRCSDDDLINLSCNTGSETVDVVGTLNINEFYNWGLRRTVIANQIYIDDFKFNIQQ